MSNNTDYQKLEHDLKEMNIDDLRKLVVEKSKDIDRFRKILAQDKADFEVMKKALSWDLQNRSEVIELEISLDKTREQYNNVIRNSNNKAQQKKLAFLERNNEQLTNVQKQLVERNSSLKKEIAITERKLLARNERIQALEALLQDAQEKLVTQNQKFEAQLQAVRERLEQARSQKSSTFVRLPFFNTELSNVKEEKEQLEEKKKQITEDVDLTEHVDLAYRDIENLRKKLQMEKEQHLKELTEKNEKIKQLQTEVARFKFQELAPQVQNRRTELEQLITNTKTKAGNLENVVDLLLEMQKQISENEKNNDQLTQAHLEGQLTAYKSILESNLTKEELKLLLDKQIELYQLEEQFSKLQINVKQQAQVFQPPIQNKC